MAWTEGKGGLRGGVPAEPRLRPQVAVVRQRDSGEVFAMKMLHKWEMLKRAEVSLGGCLQTAGKRRDREGTGPLFSPWLATIPSPKGAIFLSPTSTLRSMQSH